MTHLEDNLAEYVFEEMSPAEMEAARLHVSQCLECQSRVSSFMAVRKSLEQLPDAELPQRMVFVPEAPRRGWLSPAWALPAAAAFLLAVLAGAVFDMSWSDGGVRIAWGSGANADSPAVEPAAPAAIDYDRIDYDQLATRVRRDLSVELQSLIDADTALAARIEAVGASRNTQFENLEAELAYLVGLQQTMVRDTYQNASSIQLLAQRTGMME